ncbi:hypothetical protein KZO01_07520 [Kurthia zopfii]|uniref:Uncharacterized protein n=1 Tax=Kurthia zopfii TaxID=1650 RepID=A0A8B4Q8N5_9BACL|nr:hypothetical protein [Kurthia zopfii]PWI22377.1 hypothetical protein DF281_07240 [Kurthia zopfii]TDR38494.1 hypothetical protein DFR61_11651 [Kurthia zopfii]GEK30443.1 hypothetical protein KZO01_07520 [Kurthia zopfii]STX08584.1 Uncharacterised protein [Kurthia zopfii]
MRLASLLNNRFTEVEARKKLLTVKNVDHAYKKNAKYFETTKNPAMEELVDLLTGKKEKEDHSELQKTIENLQQQKRLEDDLTAAENPAVTPTEMMLNHDVSIHLLPETKLPDLPNVQLKDAKQMARERLTEKAIATYQFQMSMAKGGFKVLQPMIYRTA